MKIIRAIPYKNLKEKKQIIGTYKKKNKLKIYKDFVYVESKGI